MTREHSPRFVKGVNVSTVVSVSLYQIGQGSLTSQLVSQITRLTKRHAVRVSQGAEARQFTIWKLTAALNCLKLGADN